MSMGTLVKTIAMQFIADPGDAYKALDDLNIRADELKKPIDLVLTADTADAQAGVDEVTKALSDYIDAALRADEAAAKFAKVQEDNAADSDIYRKALDENTKATLAAADAQIKLTEAEAKAAEGAKATGDAEVAEAGKVTAAADETEAASAKFKLSGTMMLGIAAGIGAIGYESIKGAIDFQRSTELLQTQAGVTGQQLGQLRQGVLALASQVGFSPDSLSEAMYHVASNMKSVGGTSGQMLRVLKIAAEGAKVGNSDLTDTTNALTAAIVSGIPGVKNYGQAMGMLNAIVGSGDMTMQNLADAFGSGMVATVKGYGLSLKDVGAALAVFGDNNIRGAKAGTDLRMSVQALAAPMQAGIPILNQLGISSNQLATDMQNGGLLPALVDLQKHFRSAGITAKEQGQYITEIFGKKAGAGLNVLLDQMDRLKSKYPAISAGAHGFATAWDQTKKTVQVELDRIGGSFEALGIKIGETVLPPVEHFLGFLADHSGAVLGIAKAVGILVGALGIYTAATKAATFVTGLFDIELDANPIGIVVVAIAALVVGFIELYKHVSWFRTLMDDTGHVLAGAWREAVRLAGDVITWFTHGPLQLLKQGWHDVLHAVGDVIQWFDDGPLVWLKHEIAVVQIWWDEHQKEIYKTAEEVWKGIQIIIKWAWDHAWPIIKQGLDDLKAAWEVIWPWVSTTVKIAWDIIKFVVGQGVKDFLGAIDIALDILHGHWAAAWGTLEGLTRSALLGSVHIILDIAKGFGSLLYDAGRSVVQGLISGIESMLGSLWGLVSGIGSKIKNLKGPLDYDRVMLYPHGQAIMTGLIRGMQSVQPDLDKYLHGVSASITGGVRPSLTSGRGFGAGTVINVTVNGALDKTAVARQIEQMLIQLGRQNGGQLALFQQFR